MEKKDCKFIEKEMKKVFHESSDFKVRKFVSYHKIDTLLFFFDNIVNVLRIDREIIEPLTQSEITKNAEETENKADFDEKISDSTNNHDFDKLNENIDEHERDGTAYENKIGVKYFLNLPMDDKKVIIAGLYKLLKRFCKTVLPKSVLINAKAGTGNPAGTGLILALCGIIKGLFIEGLNISGDFDDITFLGNAEFSGRFTLGYLLYSAVCFIILKPVRKAIILFNKN